MAKRQRGSRPGQRPPGRPATRSATRPGAAARPSVPARPGSLTDEDLDRAAALEAQIVAEERVAAASVARGRERRRAGTEDLVPRGRPRASGSLTAVATDEYRYVARDLRRIVAVFILIFGLLALAFLVLVVGGVAN